MDCIVVGNRASDDAGGIWAQGTPTIGGSLFCDNTPNDIVGDYKDAGENEFPKECPGIGACCIGEVVLAGRRRRGRDSAPQTGEDRRGAPFVARGSGRRESGRIADLRVGPDRDLDWSAGQISGVPRLKLAYVDTDENAQIIGEDRSAL